MKITRFSLVTLALTVNLAGALVGLNSTPREPCTSYCVMPEQVMGFPFDAWELHERGWSWDLGFLGLNAIFGLIVVLPASLFCEFMIRKARSLI